MKTDQPWKEVGTYYIDMGHGDDEEVHADDSAAYISQEHNRIVDAALNNAAAGSRETGPVPDGENEGDLLLLLGKSPEETELLMWSGCVWNVSFGDCWEPIDKEQLSPQSWAHINFPKQQEATE